MYGRTTRMRQKHPLLRHVIGSRLPEGESNSNSWEGGCEEGEMGEIPTV